MLVLNGNMLVLRAALLLVLKVLNAAHVIVEVLGLDVTPSYQNVTVFFEHRLGLVDLTAGVVQAAGQV